MSWSTTWTDQAKPGCVSRGKRRGAGEMLASEGRGERSGQDVSLRTWAGARYGTAESRGKGKAKGEANRAAQGPCQGAR